MSTVDHHGRPSFWNGVPGEASSAGGTGSGESGAKGCIATSERKPGSGCVPGTGLVALATLSRRPVSQVDRQFGFTLAMLVGQASSFLKV